jgi:hypothetical protein
MWVSVRIRYPLFTHADAVNKNQFSHTRMRITVLKYADRVINHIRSYLYISYIYIIFNKFTKIMLF